MMPAPHLSVRPRQPARAVRQGAGERRRRRRARPRGRGRRRRQGRAREAVAAGPTARPSATAIAVRINDAAIALSPPTPRCCRGRDCRGDAAQDGDAPARSGACAGRPGSASSRWSKARAACRGGRGDRRGAGGRPARLRHPGLRARPRPRSGTSDGLLRGRRLAVASRVAGMPRRSAASPRSWATSPAAGRPGLVPPARLRRQAVHPPGPGRRDPRRAGPTTQAVEWARRVLRGRAAPGAAAARRPHDRPPGRCCGARAPSPRRPLNPSLSNWRPAMPSTIIDSHIFQGIFSTDEMRSVWSDENRTQTTSTSRPPWPRCRASSASSRRRRPTRSSATAASTRSTWSAAPADRAHRLPDHRRGQPAQHPLPRRPRRVLPLGCHDPGHHRHRHGAADPRGARPGRRRADRDLGRAWRAWPGSTATPR